MKKGAWKNLVVLGLMAGYIWICFRLYFTNKITFYVHPDFIPLTVASGGVLLLILMLLIISLGRTGSGGKLSAGIWEHKVQLALVTLPIVLLIFFAPKALSSQAFLSRTTSSGNADLGLSRSNQQPVEFVLNTENRELIDWIRLFAQNAEPDTYKDMKAKITGFVLKDDTLPANHFTLARFVISCCAADARPVGLIIKYDPAKFNPVSDQWLELKGQFIVEDIAGQRTAVLDLSEAKPIDVPANPYIS